MVMWHYMFGLGFGVVVAIVAAVLTNRPQSIKGRETTYNSTPDDNCGICLSTLDNQITYLNCGHAFHDGCMKTYRERRFRNCPICRDEI